jgi:hypothetical protein
VARSKKKNKRTLSEKRPLRPMGWDSLDDVKAALASANGAREKPKRLSRKAINVAKEGVFQWRQYDMNSYASTQHVVGLTRALKETEKPFEPLLLFPAGDRYYVIDGHHRLAAYEAADWNEPIPVEVFEGELEDARLAGLTRNHKDKLPMTSAEKSEAAWRLVKEEQLNRPQIVGLGLVSRTTATTMKRTWDAIKEHSEARAASWVQARRWGEKYESDPDWQTKAAEALMKRLVETGIAKEMLKAPDIAALALEMLNATLPMALTMEWGPEVVEWVRDLHHEDEQEPYKF